MATDTRHTEQLVRDYVAWVNGDTSKRDALSESVDVYNPGLQDGEVHTRAAYEAQLQAIGTGFLNFELAGARSSRVATTASVEFTVTGTNDGEFKGIPATGRDVEIRGARRSGPTTAPSRRCARTTTRRRFPSNSD